jgi:hypothetical protein
MSDRAAFVRGLDILAGLYSEYPSLPQGGNAQQINLHQYGRVALEPAEQISLVVAVIEHMDAPVAGLALNRGAESAWFYVRGHLAGRLVVSVQMWADDVCERRPEERRKRDRWVLPPEVAAAVEARAAAEQAGAVPA